MDTTELLKKILQITVENNTILKKIQEEGITISLPKLDNVQEEPNIPIVVKETKPKISKISNGVIENNSGVTAWIDVETGLTWEFKPDDRKNLIMSQKETLAYVDNLNVIEYSGFHDWRIPTLKELKTLIKNKKTNFSYIKPPLSKNTNYAYWTSTKYDENFYMTVNFNTGHEIKSMKDNLEYVRCVRGTMKTK